MSVLFFHSQGKEWLDSELESRGRTHDSVSKYDAAAKRESGRNTGNGTLMVPPLPDSVEEIKN